MTADVTSSTLAVVHRDLIIALAASSSAARRLPGMPQFAQCGRSDFLRG